MKLTRRCKFPRLIWSTFLTSILCSIVALSFYNDLITIPNAVNSILSAAKLERRQVASKNFKTITEEDYSHLDGFVVILGSHKKQQHAPNVTLNTSPEALNFASLGLDTLANDNSLADKASTDDSQGEACKLPQFELNDPELAHFFHTSEPLDCGADKPWTQVRNGTVFVRPEIVESLGGVNCTIDEITRTDEFNVAKTRAGNFSNSYNLTSEYAQVTCKGTNSTNKQQTDYILAIVPKTDVFSRTKSINSPENSKKLDNANKNNSETKSSPNLSDHPKKLNVYMLGFDSLSRMTFMRKLPKSYQYLKDTLKGVVLEGYNIVGDGTPQALIPMLTGQTELELPGTRKRDNDSLPVNVYPWVWNEFGDAGYATMYEEDMTAYGTFTYRLNGFDDVPVDHYARPYYVYVEETVYSSNIPLCFGPEAKIVKHFGYAEQFWRTYGTSVPKFAFSFFGVMSHDDLNLIGSADDMLLDHLRLFDANNWLNDTILILFADHGHRFAEIRETQQGKLEERNPFYSLVLPPWFEKVYPKAAANLARNALRLSTPFDIHATLRRVISGWGGIENPPSEARELVPETGKIERSISLFDEIPVSRTCADAAIEPHWCACLSWEPMGTSDPVSLQLASLVVDVINRETLIYRERCARLELSRVTSALRYVPSESVLRFQKTKDPDGFVPDLTGNANASVIHFQIRFIAEPLAAHYEASVAADFRSQKATVDLGAISHINRYGDAPHCIQDEDYFMIKWCKCYDKI